MLYGYVLMNAKLPSVDPFAAHIGQGILQQNIFEDYDANKNSGCRALIRLLNKLNDDDCWAVCSLNQLGMDLACISKVWEQITVHQKASIRVLEMESMFSTSDIEINNALSNIFANLLFYLSKTKNRYHKQRQAEGIAQHQAASKKMERRPKEIPQTIGYWMS